MIWFIIGLIIIGILYVLTLISLGGVKKINRNPNRKYMFRYYLASNTNDKALPIRFLEEWKVSKLENNLYLLYLTLDDSLYILGYLLEKWNGYHGGEVIVEVYLYTCKVDVYLCPYCQYDKIGGYKVLDGGGIKVTREE